MNEIAGVKEKILDTAKNIAAEDGIASISIRSVATKCGIAVGTVYNHFPNKGDLIAAVIEDFWQSVFKTMDFGTINKLPPVSALSVFYFQLAECLSSFKVNWLEQLSLLGTSEKLIGRAKEKEIFGRITAFIGRIIAKSAVISKEYSEADLEKLSLFIFDSMMAMLKRGETDFTFAERLLTKILH